MYIVHRDIVTSLQQSFTQKNSRSSSLILTWFLNTKLIYIYTYLWGVIKEFMRTNWGRLFQTRFEFIKVPRANQVDAMNRDVGESPLYIYAYINSVQFCEQSICIHIWLSKVSLSYIHNHQLLSHLWKFSLYVS